MIELKNVSKYYHSGDVTNLGLHNVSLEFQKNEIVAITGDSGSGKSTLLNVITKIDSFDEGEIYYKGNETSYFNIQDMDDFRKNKIGFIFQNYNILDSYTVLENVMLPLTLKGLPRKEAKQKALSLIEKVGLSGHIKSRGTKLSGGEKQRCVIARALASDCEILACDEPTGNLDSKTGEEIIRLIHEVAKDKLVLIVTHNFDQVKDIVTRKIRVTDGEITEDVILAEQPKDPEQELEMEYVPLKKKVCANVAKNNVLFTPRKTILLSLIFMAICFATLFIFQTIYISQTGLSSSSVYNNVLSNRYVVYNSDHTVLDESLLSGYSYDKNSFCEDEEMPVYFDKLDNFGETAYVYYSDRYNAKLKYGNLPSKENEVLITVNPDSWNASRNMFGSYICGEKFSYDGKEYTIAGIAHSTKVTGIIISGNTGLRDRLNYAIVRKNMDLVVDGASTTLYLSRLKEVDLKTPYIEMPSSYKNSKVEVTLFGIYSISNVDIKYNDAAKDITYYYSDVSEMELPLFEASVYANKNPKKALNKTGLTVDHCVDVTNDNALEHFITNVLAYALMALASAVLIIVFFITYVILARVYASRKKDYEILRTLGVTKRDMKHIVIYEVMGVCASILAISFVIFVILLNCVPSFKNLGKMTVGTALIYFAVTLLFGYCIARRFNRRLFRFSVTKSMKGDAKHD